MVPFSAKTSSYEELTSQAYIYSCNLVFNPRHGKVPLSMLNFFSSECSSTCILRDTILQPSAGSGIQPSVNGGMLNLMPRGVQLEHQQSNTIFLVDSDICTNLNKGYKTRS